LKSDPAQAPFGRLLRHWRQQRHVSQLHLALQAEVSARHLSCYVLGRLQRQLSASGDAQLHRLLVELRALPAPAERPDTEAAPTWDVAVPLSLNTPTGLLNFITTITVFGAPHDITLAELAVETFLPADATTAAAMQALLLSSEARG
jgi:transcriptional regulator with XRE-family HTH domain